MDDGPRIFMGLAIILGFFVLLWIQAAAKEISASMRKKSKKKAETKTYELDEEF
jgi:hypothetical protein